MKFRFILSSLDFEIRKILYFVILVPGLYHGGVKAQYNPDIEVSSPMHSWLSIRKEFHARGDGKTDDTRAFQKALDLLNEKMDAYQNRWEPKFYVLFIPAGTYCISSTLRLNGKFGISIIGESKEKVRLKWTGKENDTMFVSNGSSYLKFTQITWDGSGIKGTRAVGIHWLDKVQGKYAPTSLELSNMDFVNGLDFGICGGTYAHEGTGSNDAEVLIKNCAFRGVLNSGVYIHGYNALDYWIWNCSFSDCGTGVSCFLGNYHVYNSVFSNSRVTDLYNRDCFYTSVRGCRSESSNQFSVDEGSSCNAFKRIFQDNFVRNTNLIPVEYHSQGRLSFINNVFKKGRSISNVSINYGGWCPAIYQVMSLNNYFEDSVGIYIGKGHPSRIYSVGDKHYFRRRPLDFDSTALGHIYPGVPAAKIVRITPSFSNHKIQKIINSVSGQGNEMTILHFEAGEYTINKTIRIPAKKNIMIRGDGILYSTVLKPGFLKKSDPVILVEGPSQATLTDFQIDLPPGSDRTGIRFVNLDQKSSEVRMDQLYIGAAYAVVVEGYNHTYFEKNNSFYSSGNVLTGGELQRSGKGSMALHCFGGQAAKTKLENNAVMVAKDCWWEGAFKKDFLPLDLESGSGRLSVSGALFAPSDLDTGVSVRIGNFKGRVTLCDMYVYGGLEVSGNHPDLNVLLWNINLMRKTDAYSNIKRNSQSKIFISGMTTQCSPTLNSGCPEEKINSNEDLVNNVSNREEYISVMMNDLGKAMPRNYKVMSTSVSNVYISRVSVTGGKKALLFN